MNPRESLNLSPQQLVIGTLTVVLSFLWYMSGFLTLREHNEFVFRFNADISRLAAEQAEQNHQVLMKLDTRESQNQARLALDSLNERIRMIQRQLDALSAREDRRHANEK